MRKTIIFYADNIRIKTHPITPTGISYCGILFSCGVNAPRGTDLLPVDYHGHYYSLEAYLPLSSNGTFMASIACSAVHFMVSIKFLTEERMA